MCEKLLNLVTCNIEFYRTPKHTENVDTISRTDTSMDEKGYGE